jgi:hypothetical protein
VPAGTKDPRALTYVVDHVRPGVTFTRRFQVCNGTSQPITVSLYPGSAHLSDGSFQIDAGHATNELTSWIAIQPSTATIPAGSRFLARATFAVPRQAEAGERYAVLLAELPPAPGASGVSVSSRVGVRVYLDVGPGGAPRSDFVVDSLQAARGADGHAEVTAQVHNTGKRALDFTGSLLLRSGPGGQSGGPYPAKLGTTLAPGQTEPVLVPISSVIADGPWTAQLTLRSGLLERRVGATLMFPSAAGAQAPPVDVEQLPVAGDAQIHPGRSIAAVAIALLLIATIAAVRRRRQ